MRAVCRAGLTGPHVAATQCNRVNPAPPRGASGPRGRAARLVSTVLARQSGPLRVGGRCCQVELSKLPPRLVVFDAWTDEVSRGESDGALQGLAVQILGRDRNSSAQRGRDCGGYVSRAIEPPAMSGPAMHVCKKIARWDRSGIKRDTRGDRCGRRRRQLGHDRAQIRSKWFGWRR